MDRPDNRLAIELSRARLQIERQSNRWARFKSSELGVILEGLVSMEPSDASDSLHDEIMSDIKRRVTLPS